MDEYNLGGGAYNCCNSCDSLTELHGIPEKAAGDDEHGEAHHSDLHSKDGSGTEEDMVVSHKQDDAHIPE